MTADVFRSQLAAASGLAQRTLSAKITETGDVADAMRYASTGGKGLRAFLVIESARMFGIDPKTSVPAAAAIEAIHAYSLVHDDLPAMDNDDLRRGQPTVHVKWDDATAILAGDALQSLAFDLLTDLDFPADTTLSLVRGLAKAAGAGGMVGGQELDIAAETAPTPLSLAEITRLQAGKTGALISWSATSGAVMAHQNLIPLASYAEALGLAFQITDDILDEVGDEAKTGKRVQKDASAGKATFVSLLGLETARARAQELVSDAKDALSPYGNKSTALIAAADFVLTRDH